MNAYLCLLHAVNVAGRKVPAGELRELAGALGFTHAATVANSGTLVVAAGASGATHTRDVTRILHEAVSQHYGFDVLVSTITMEHVGRLMDRNPFRVMADAAPSRLLVYIGQKPIDEAGVADLDLANPGPEHLEVSNGVLYVTYPLGVGASRLTIAKLTQAAKTPVTGRNWNSFLRARQIGQDLVIAGT